MTDAVDVVRILGLSITGAVAVFVTNLSLYKFLINDCCKTYFESRSTFADFLFVLALIGLLLPFMFLLPFVVVALFMYEELLSPCFSWIYSHYKDHRFRRENAIRPLKTPTPTPSTRMEVFSITSDDVVETPDRFDSYSDTSSYVAETSEQSDVIPNTDRSRGPGHW